MFLRLMRVGTCGVLARVLQVEPEAWEELTPAVRDYLASSASGSSAQTNGPLALALRPGGPGSATSRLANASSPKRGGASALSSMLSSLDSQDGSEAGPPGLPPLPPAAALPPPSTVDLALQLRTWEPPPCGCPPAVPCQVGQQVDLVSVHAMQSCWLTAIGTVG